MNAERIVLSKNAEKVMHQLVVVEGRSYPDAIRFAEQQAERVAAPYRQVAHNLRVALAEIDARDA